MKILPSKNENFQIKNSDMFHISAQNIDCGYSLELRMFLSRNKKNKVGFKGFKIIQACFRDGKKKKKNAHNLCG